MHKGTTQKNMCLNENLQGTKRQKVAYRFQFKL